MHIELYSQEAEESIISTILMNNDVISKIQYLQPKHFHVLELGELYELILSKCKTQDEVSSIDFVEWSKARFPDDPSYIWKLESKFSGGSSVARKIKDLADKRELQSLLTQKMAELESSGTTAGEIIDSLNDDFLGFHKSHSHFKVKTFGEVCRENIADMDIESKVYPTGFVKIDKSMNGGLHAGCSYAIAAKPKAGKTMIKGTIASNLRKGTDKFLFIAAEMGSRAINKRLLGGDLNRSPKAFESDKGSDKFRSSIEFIASNDTGAMLYVDAPRVSLDDLRSIIRKAIYQHGITGFILDYIQLVSGGGENRVQHLENVAQTIAEICKQENIWALYSAQVNREGTLRGGDGIIMAVEWLYELKKHDTDGNDYADAHMEHIATRETEPMNLGSEDNPCFRIANTGTHFTEI